MEGNTEIVEYIKRIGHFPSAFNLDGANKLTIAKLRSIEHKLDSELDINDGCEQERIIKMNLLTWVRFRLGKEDEALQLSRDVIELTERRNVASLANCSFIMWQKGDEVEAMKCLEDLEKMKSANNFQTQFTDAQAEQAYYYSRLGDLKNLQRAIKLFCDLPKTPINYLRTLGLGLVYRRMTHMNIAYSSPERLTVEDYNKRAAECLFEVAEKADNRLSSQAYAQLVHLRRSYPVNLAVECEEIFRGFSVEKLCEKALEHGHNIPTVLVDCGTALKSINIDRSIDLLKKSIAIKEDSTAYHHLGLCYKRKAEQTAKLYRYYQSRSEELNGQDCVGQHRVERQVHSLSNNESGTSGSEHGRPADLNTLNQQMNQPQMGVMRGNGRGSFNHHLAVGNKKSTEPAPGNTHTIYLPPGNKQSMYLPLGNKQSMYLPPGNKQSMYLPPGNNKSMFLPPGNNESMYLPPGNNHSMYLPPGNNKSMYLPPGNNKSMFLPPGNNESMYLPPGNNHSMYLPPGKIESTYLPSGNNQSMYLPPGKNESMYLPLGNNESMYLPPENIQRMGLRPEYTQSMDYSDAHYTNNNPNEKTSFSSDIWRAEQSLEHFVRRCRNVIILNKDDENVQKAHEYFKKAIELANENIPAIFDLGILLKDTNQTRDALIQFNSITIISNPSKMYRVTVISAYEQAGLCYLELSRTEGSEDYKAMGKNKLTKAVSIAADLINTMPELRGSHKDVWIAFTTLLTEIDKEQTPENLRFIKKFKILELAREHGDIIDVVQTLKRTEHKELANPDIVKPALASFLQEGQPENALVYHNLVAMNPLVQDSDWWNAEPMRSLRIKVLLNAIAGRLKESNVDNPTDLFQQLFKFIFGSCVGLRDTENDQQTDTSSVIRGDVLFIFDSEECPDDVQCLKRLTTILFGLEAQENMQGTGEPGDRNYIQLKEMLKYQIVIFVLGNEERDGYFNAMLQMVSYNSQKAPPNHKILVVNTGVEDENIPQCLKQYKSLKLADIGVLADPRRIPGSWNDTDNIPYMDIIHHVFDGDVDAVLKLFCFMIEQTWPCP